jgi:alpha,alpha-trehalase
MGKLPIADYAVISDCHSAALISSGGSIDWLCFPDFDSPSVFGRLLDDDAGHWSILARDTNSWSRRYIADTMVLETTFQTSTGVVVLTDAMALGDHERGHDIGRGAPHSLLRSLSCAAGSVQIDVEYAPRPEYGLTLPSLERRGGALYSQGGAGMLLLSTPVNLDVSNNIGCATFLLFEGETVYFALQHGVATEPIPPILKPEEIEQRSKDAVEAWRSWSGIHQNYQGPWRDLVAHSGRVLQALTYFPTGAIVAAATTSLPEVIGGNRNWDYRFTWVRDSSFTLEALWVAACPEEANKFFTFLAAAAFSQVRAGNGLQIMFGIRGEHDLTERSLEHLSGWRNSKPVRVGNGAWNQRQLDVYGELINAVYLFKDRIPELDRNTRDFLIGLVDSASSEWRQKDQGIWEIRGEPRHFLYSKLMCWVALDRGIRLAEALEVQEKVIAWRRSSEELRRAILEDGWNQTACSFTQAFGSEDLDASALMIPIVGFLPADDPRVLATIDAISSRLTDRHGLVFRYLTQDGLAGQEGSFLLCTFWLAQAQALAGQLDRANETFGRAIRFANDVHLFAEEVLPETRELLGNFPQAFSHIGLINAAWAISGGESKLV